MKYFFWKFRHSIHWLTYIIKIYNIKTYIIKFILGIVFLKKSMFTSCFILTSIDVDWHSIKISMRNTNNKSVVIRIIKSTIILCTFTKANCCYCDTCAHILCMNTIIEGEAPHDREDDSKLFVRLRYDTLGRVVLNWTKEEIQHKLTHWDDQKHCLLLLSAIRG